MLKKLLFAFAVLLSASGLAACGNGAALGAISDQPPVYTLGAGDKVRVTVFGEQSVNGDYSVGTDGSIALPLIGNIAATGNSVAQLQEAITRKLASGYLLDPKVSVEVLNYRPYFILGEVNKPGTYPYVDALSVTQAVAIAGGYTYRANTSRVFIRRAGETEEMAYKVKHGNPAWVKPGDTIRVGERYF